MEAAFQKYGGKLDAKELLSESEYTAGSVARLMAPGIHYENRGAEDNTAEEDEQWLDLGEDSEQDMAAAMDAMVRTAVDNGLSDSGVSRVRGILQHYRDVFRLRLGNDPAADVEPMKVVLKPGSTPVFSKARRYSPEQRDFMAKYVGKLEEYGFVKVNTNASWAAAPLLVPKPPPANYRLTFDLRPINARTVASAWPLPHIDSELLDVAGSKVFATIDFCSGYWQLPLDEVSQDLHAFMTPSGIYKPTRTLQGATNSGSNFQSRVEPCFAEMRGKYKAWLDDFMLFSKSEEDLLKSLEIFVKICHRKGLKISARKTVLFCKEVRWCGRLVDEKGVRCDPSNLSGLQNIHLPDTAGELCQYVHCLQWMSMDIPDFAERIAPLRSILEEAYKSSGSRKKKSIKNMKLSSLSWAKEHETSFRSLQVQLEDSVRLSHRNPEKSLCVFTDASDAFWAGVVTQCVPSELSKPVQDQKHKPLAFLSSSFNDTERRWSTMEKEGFAIFQVFKRLDYMFATEEMVHIFSDHRNLLFIYNPMSIEPTLGRYIVNKVQRWALFLSKFNYLIEHVGGEVNVMPDIMTRWFRGYRGKRLSVKRITHLLVEQDIVQSPLNDLFEWPDVSLVRKAQIDRTEEIVGRAKADDDGLYRCKAGKLLIPESDSELQLKLLVIAHCGAGGHRGLESTFQTLCESYVWSNMRQDCEEFLEHCIHCIPAKSGLKIPRPLSLAVHGSYPNEVIHFDYLYMGRGTDNLKYILVIRDDLSSYMLLCPTEVADAETTARELARWIRTFTAMSTWVSDQASHFKNLVMEQLATDHNIRHSFTVAYSPWVNGTVEICMRHILAACRALSSELKLAPHDWPRVVGMIMTTLNEAPLARLGKNRQGVHRSPLQVMTGLSPSRSQLVFTLGNTEGKEMSLTKLRACQVLEIESLQSSFENMHKQVKEKVTTNRLKNIKTHNARTNIVHTRYSVGDFVLERRAQNKGHKLQFRWVGPRRVKAVLSDVVYDVEGIIDSKVETIHAARLMLYRASQDGAKISPELLAHAEHSEAKYEEIEALHDIGENLEGIFVHTEWVGLPDKTDWTWQPIRELHEDVPEKFEAFLEKIKKKKMAKKAKIALGLAA